MAGEIVPSDAPPARDGAPQVHVRTVVIRPTTALGKLALAAGLIAMGVALVTIGIAFLAGLAAVAAVTGVGIVAYRAFAGGGRAQPPAIPMPPSRLDPSGEVFLPKPKD